MDRESEEDENVGDLVEEDGEEREEETLEEEEHSVETPFICKSAVETLATVPRCAAPHFPLFTRTSLGRNILQQPRVPDDQPVEEEGRPEGDGQPRNDGHGDHPPRVDVTRLGQVDGQSTSCRRGTQETGDTAIIHEITGDAAVGEGTVGGYCIVEEQSLGNWWLSAGTTIQRYTPKCTHRRSRKRDI